MKSLPPGLVVKESGIHGAGLGVWSTEEFPARTLFGPYGGEIVLNKENAHKSGYAWQVDINCMAFQWMKLSCLCLGGTVPNQS